MRTQSLRSPFSAFGVVLESEVRLHPKAPSFVLELRETTIALGAEIAREIYVKQIVDQPPRAAQLEK